MTAGVFRRVVVGVVRGARGGVAVGFSAAGGFSARVLAGSGPASGRPEAEARRAANSGRGSGVPGFAGPPARKPAVRQRAAKRSLRRYPDEVRMSRRLVARATIAAGCHEGSPTALVLRRGRIGEDVGRDHFPECGENFRRSGVAVDETLAY